MPIVRKIANRDAATLTPGASAPPPLPSRRERGPGGEGLPNNHTPNAEHHDLPMGWAWTTLESVCHVERGITFPASAKNDQLADGYIACMRTANVQTSVDWDDLIYIPRSYVRTAHKLLRQHDILVSMAYSRELVGKVSFVDHVYSESTFGGFIAAIRALESVDPRLLFYFLRLDQTQEQLRSGSNQTVNIANISLSGIYSVELPVPPLSEQRRIVEAIEQQLTRLDAGMASLKRVQAGLRRYRAAVLKAACEGRLVPQDPGDEPADALLRRILDERRAKWEAEQIARGKDPRKVKYEEPHALTPDPSPVRRGAEAVEQLTFLPAPPRREKEEPAPPLLPQRERGLGDEGLPELPRGWVWATMSQLLHEPLRNGHSAKAVQGNSGVRTLTLTAVTIGDFSIKNTKLTSADPERVKDMWLEPGDILIERSNTPELVGTARLYRGERGFAIFPDLIIRARVTSLISEKFIEAVLLSDRARNFFRSAAQGIAGSMPKIDQTTVEQLIIPLPPLAEQHRIVAEVERRLSVVTEVEAAVAANLKRAERLRQAILKRAFEGKLVPQDPSDEPASVLLERIRRERDQETGRQGDKETRRREAKQLRMEF
jgi:type I restriction enzyme, S subunit